MPGYLEYNIKALRHTLLLDPKKSTPIMPGDGYIVGDPLDAIRVPVAPFQVTDVERNSDDKSAYKPKSNSLISCHAISHESNSVEEEASRISAYFTAKYGQMRASLAYETAKRILETSIVYYIEIDITSPGATIRSDQVSWSKEPKAEVIIDYQERLEQFLEDHGSHYVTTVHYGQRLIVRICAKSRTESVRSNLEAAVQAVALCWNAGARISASASSFLQSSMCEVDTLLIAGKIEPEGSFYFMGIEQALTFFNKIKDPANGIVIESGPISCEVYSYRHTLTNFPNCKQLFSQNQSTPPPAPYGIPKGTIVAWYPDVSCVIVDSSTGKKQITLPIGWAICNGDNTPNLVDRFLMGTESFELLSKIGGSNIIPSGGSHSHLGQTINCETSGSDGPFGEGQSGRDDDNRPWSTRFTAQFNLKTDSCVEHNHGGDNRPAFYSIIYIIKL